MLVGHQLALRCQLRQRLLLEDEPFLLTYGDGVADIDVQALTSFHREHGRKATVTAVQPAGRFGALSLDRDRVITFTEKVAGDGGWVSGGFFVLDPSCIDLVDGDDVIWEQGPVEALASGDQLRAYQHDGFWQPMDTLRDKHRLEELWATGRAPWRVW